MKQSRGSRALVGKTAIKFADKYFCLVYYYYLLNNSRDRNPAGGGGEIFRTRPHRPWDSPILL